MLSGLLNVPSTKNQWDSWSFSHRNHHDQIRRAIQLETGGATNLFQYQLDPIPENNFDDWLARNQQAHNDMNQVLGLQGVDLSSVDVKDRKKLEAWVYTHWQEHQAAATTLGI